MEKDGNDREQSGDCGVKQGLEKHRCSARVKKNKQKRKFWGSLRKKEKDDSNRIKN